jgi:two-component system, NtrC family, C4-dicarboxylate transport sensor histidine kinase DctB
MIETLLQALPFAWVLLQADHRIHSFSPSAQQLCQHTLQRQRPLPNWVDPEIREALLQKDAVFWPQQRLQWFVSSFDYQSQIYRLLFLFPSDYALQNATQLAESNLKLQALAHLGKTTSEIFHEMNNPLAAISMSVSMIERALKVLLKTVSTQVDQPEKLHPLFAEQQRHLDKMKESIHKLSYLRENVLHNTSSQKRERVLFWTVVETCLSSFIQQPIFRAMHLHLSPNESRQHWVKIDAIQFEQILFNLLNNAREATQGIGTVWISDRSLDHQAVLEIQDNGPGIAPELHDLILSPFQTTKKNQGSGLGLSISKQMIEAMGGTLDIREGTEKGACFVITFPTQPGETA